MQLLLINSRINNAFYNLRSNQLPIDPPASEDQAAIIAQAEDNDLLSSFPVLLTVGGVHVGLPTIDPERIAGGGIIGSQSRRAKGIFLAHSAWATLGSSPRFMT